MRAELQLIRFGGVGVTVADVNVIDQADVIASLLCRQRNRVCTIREYSVRNSETRPYFLLSSEVEVPECGPVQGDSYIVLLTMGDALENDIDNTLASCEVGEG